MPVDARQRLIVALDVPSSSEASRLIEELNGVVSFFKVGLELFLAGGPEIVRSLVSQGNHVFLDLKFLDIDETVRRAARQAAALGVSFLTVHESGRTVAAAVEGARGTGLKILAVTVLTSMDAADIRRMGFTCPVEELVLARAKKALEAGCHGVVASGREAAKIRKLSRDLGQDVIIVTPGIRPAGAEPHDQKRATTPAEAIRAGADYLVVGRPIRDAHNPTDTARRIVQEMQAAFDTAGE